MAALSIAIVQSEARKQVSPHLTLTRRNSENCFEWIFDDGSQRNVQKVPIDKIRGLKLDEWLRYAKALAGGEAIVGAPPVILNAPASVTPTGPAGGPNPSFMLVRNTSQAIPFDPDPEAQGHRDATRGFTANPYGMDEQRKLWNRGHDKAYDEGLAEKPRFGRNIKNRN